MTPTIFHQDWLISRFEDDPLGNIKNNHIYVMVTKDGVVVKRIINNITTRGVVTCHSDALGNPSFDIDMQDILQVYSVEAKISFNLTNLNASIIQRLDFVESELSELRKTVEK